MKGFLVITFLSAVASQSGYRSPESVFAASETVYGARKPVFKSPASTHVTRQPFTPPANKVAYESVVVHKPSYKPASASYRPGYRHHVMHKPVPNKLYQRPEPTPTLALAYQPSPYKTTLIHPIAYKPVLAPAFNNKPAPVSTHKLTPAPYKTPTIYKPAYKPTTTRAYKPSPVPAYKSDLTYGYHGESLKLRPYEFQYAVNDHYNGAVFSQNEHGDDYGNVEGYYSVNLPDGRVQHVKYVANDYGNNAEVTYEGEVQYPEYYSQYPIKPALYKQTLKYSPALYKPGY